ncbi:hypothetical protein BUALT_Bualt05G0009800 [Buddleja alternifolia]|uniref:Poly(A) polymerase nucleotidyltransferase domain-containing protein n=1 Tax=Buddleja alternifolia TaxID=168488 RepID=A0AAV6XFN1_9LAMI|nr:hypothetical protein BUALT_Bualt05G0009800 [Buddleja alternifolia]
MEVHQRSETLLQFMRNERLAPSPREESKRIDAIDDLKKIVRKWASWVASQRGLPRGYVCAKIQIFGSYGLGVHNSNSDIDALCIVSYFVTLEDFFGVLRDMLASTPGVSDILCIKNAKVPQIKFSFDGVKFDLPYARLNAASIHEALGYLGGIHLAVLAALICQRHPNETLSVLVSVFFDTYATWRWEAEPVILEDDNMPPMSRMRIQYCDSNITKSTFDIIKTEFRRAHDFLVRDFDWRPLFEVVSYAKNYESFLKICVSSRHKNELGDWVGWVKSRMPQLLFKLEKLPGFCHPNPTTYGGSDLSKVFYWGLDTNKSNIINVESIKKDFTRISMGRHGPLGTMELSVVNASEFHEAKTNNRSTSMRATRTRRTRQNYGR